MIDSEYYCDRQHYIFVVNKTIGVVEQRAIKQGIEGLAKREILEGVKPGEKLVTEANNRLVNGAPVEIIPYYLSWWFREVNSL